MNAIKQIVMGLVVACAATASVADTYYWFGTNPNGVYNDVFAGTTAAGANYGWSTDPNATKATVAHTVSADHDYVVPTYSTSPARYPRVPPCTFAGKTLKLIGTLPLGVATGTFTFNTIIGSEYTGTATAVFANWMQNTTMTVIADFLINEGQAIAFKSTNDAATTGNRNFVIGDSSHKMSGAGSLILAPQAAENGTSATYELAADASEFTGTINVGYNSNNEFPSVMKKPFYFVLSSPVFNGTITELPATTDTRVNYDALPAGKGLRILTTTVPAALKTKLYFWSPTADFTAKNFPLMTFPANTSVTVADFTVYYGSAKSTTPTIANRMAFEDLGVQINADGSMTLVANYEGQAVDLNEWETEPVLTKAKWMERDDEPGEVTEPVAKYGAETMTATISKDGAAPIEWDRKMPTEVGNYKLTWSVEATDEYTGLFVDRQFSITAYVDPVESTVRYFANGGTYWKGAGALHDAMNALPPAGGIIELNKNYQDTQSHLPLVKPIVLRSSTHPTLVDQRFTLSFNTGPRVQDSLVVSNLVWAKTSGENYEQISDVSGLLRLESGSAINGFQFRVNKNGGTFELAGGTVSKSSSGSYPGSIITGAAGSKIVLRSGAITNNVITDASAAAAVQSNGGTIEIEGSPIVWGNRYRVNAQSPSVPANILPSDDARVTLVGDLAADAKLGVSYGSQPGDTFGVRTAGNPGKAFVCDANEKLCGVAKSDGYLHWKPLLSGLTIYVQ